MAEQVMIVCDVCGKPAKERVTFRIGGRNHQKDLCEPHLAELLRGSATPRRGRRPSTLGGSATKASAPKRRGRRKAATT